MATPISDTQIDQDQAPASTALIRSIAVLFVLFILLLTYLLTVVWPIPVADGKGWVGWVTVFDRWKFDMAPDVRLLWIVVISSSIGSYVHAVTSFASYVGNRTLQRSWLWWYVLRTPIGVALSLTFYFVIRGGLFSGNALGTDVSPFGVAALAGLSGMFSKQATDKLRELFDNLFRTAPGKGDDSREDKLDPKTGQEKADEAAVKKAAGG